MSTSHANELRIAPEGERSNEQVLAIARRFARERIDSYAASWERERRYPRETITAAAAQGLCGLLVPPGLGGFGLGVSGTASVMEALAYSDMGFAFSLVCHNNLAGAIAKRGSAQQREKYLGPMQAGEMLGAFMLTEPGTGSDATALKTTAIANDQGWRLNGEKAWVTNGSAADVLSVYAQTEPDSGAAGIAAFLIDANQPGVHRDAAYEMLGGHSTGTAAFRFEDVQLKPEQLFVPVGQAFGAAMEAIDIARIVVSGMCAGMLRRGLETAVEYVQGREAFGRPLSEQQGLQWMLADVATDLEAMVALTQRASAAIDNDDPAMGVKAAHAKKFATRAALSGLTQCMQALGANGFRHDRPLARHLAGAKMAQYLDGTTEIQNVVIARSLFGRAR